MPLQNRKRAVPTHCSNERHRIHMLYKLNALTKLTETFNRIACIRDMINAVG